MPVSRLKNMHALESAFLKCVKASRRRVAMFACAVGLFFVGWSLSAPDLDRTQGLALEKYGQRAADTVIAWRKLMNDTKGQSETDMVTAVNTFFNRRILFEDDIVLWKMADYWASPLEFMGRGAGDCEDFSISKYITLRMLGISNDRLRMIYVRAQIGGASSTTSVAHMVLGYYAEPNGEPLILDNLIGSVRPAGNRTDLQPVFSFNSEGLWVAGSTTSTSDPTTRLSRWRDVLDRMRQEGVL
jgi:predicted transglutaminase-like cysteine proteinase